MCANEHNASGDDSLRRKSLRGVGEPRNRSAAQKMLVLCGGFSVQATVRIDNADYV